MTDANDQSKRDFIKKAGSLALGAAALGTTPVLAAVTNIPTKHRPLAGQTALITGAARGIGAAIALKLAEQGANIALLDIANPNALQDTISYKLASQDDLNKTTEKITATGAKSLPIIADVRDRAAMKKAVAQTVSTFGNLDIIVANAAIAPKTALFEHEDQSVLKALMDVNVGGVANTAHASIPALKTAKNGGRFIAISSVSGRQGMSHIATYAASKWAVIGLIKSLSLELGPHNITANCIAPTGVKTTMLLGAYDEKSWSASATDLMAREHHSLPIGLLEPEDIANAAAFLASNDAAHISGITLDVNAGWSGKLTG